MATDRVDELAARARGGDRDALGRLYEELRPATESLLRRYRRAGAEGPLEPADLSQQAYLILADLARSWQGRGPFIAWFRRLFPLAILSYRRQMLCWDGPPVESMASADLAELLDAQGAQATGPDLCDVVYCRQLLALLPPPYRRLVYWRFVDGLTYRDIERLHGVPAATAQLRCERALAFLRAEARGEGPRPLPQRERSGEREGPPWPLLLPRLWALADSRGLLPPAGEACASLGLGRRAYDDALARLRESGCLGKAAGATFASHHGRRWRVLVDLAEARRRLG